MKKNNKRIKGNVEFVGPICESSDIIAKDISLPSQQMGNHLVIHDTGAYGVMIPQVETASEAEKAVKDCLKEKKFGEAGTKLIIEEFLEGEEASFIAVVSKDKIEVATEFLETLDVYALITGMDLAPLTLKEAQLMEKPVIATDVGGDKEMMVDKKTGFLVKEGNADDIIKRVTELLENKQSAKDMGKEGVKFVKEQFNWERVAKNFLDIIKPYVDTK